MIGLHMMSQTKKWVEFIEIAPFLMLWKQFSFFEKQDFSKQLPEDVTCSSASTNHIYIGYGSGVVMQLNQALIPLLMWKSNNKLTFLKTLKNNCLLAIGEDSDTKNSLDQSHQVMKIFNMNQIDPETASPQIIKSIKISHKNKHFPVTCFAVLDTLNFIAIGLENGVVLLYRDYKPKVVLEGGEMITALGFRNDTSQTSLFIVTMKQIFCCNTSEKDIIITIEQHGEDRMVASISPQDKYQEMVIAKREAVYFYEPNGRGPCFLIAGFVFVIF
jgi:hypothetical protein